MTWACTAQPQQSGKGITVGGANLLIADIGYVLGHPL